MAYKAAIIPCSGIGDALLMMIASHHFRTAGYEVTTFHPALQELKEWFPGHVFKPRPPLEDLYECDVVIVENDNSSYIHSLAHAREEKKIKRLHVFYPSHSPAKNPPLTLEDKVFDPTKSMVDNISWALSEFSPSKENGLQPPPDLTFQKYPRRILIHPLSSSEKKNWRKNYFLAVAQRLQKKGFFPVFAMSPRERGEWKGVEDIPLLPTLDALARLLYESGGVIGNDSLVGHLASNMGLPSLIIGDDEKRMHLWRPGWYRGTVMTPSRWVPNMKGARLRERYWQFFIGPRAVCTTAELLFGQTSPEDRQSSPKQSLE